MAKRKDSSKKKRKGSGNGLLIAAVLLTILFLAGVMSLGALYYLEKNKEKPQTIPPKITEAAAVVTQTEEQTEESDHKNTGEDSRCRSSGVQKASYIRQCGRSSFGRREHCGGGKKSG